MTGGQEVGLGATPAVVGIDLGTSHTALAFAARRAGAEPEQLPISQWVAGRRWGQQALLPSVLYAPLANELPEPAAASPSWICGEYARIRSQETVGRGITSPKSWLCHSGVDRLGPILPWQQLEVAGLEKVSPVEASRRLLDHVRAAFERSHPELSLESSTIVLTVPASFDQTARKLTVLAAARAGLHVRLLEEPQAVFYEYLARFRPELEQLVARLGRLTVLVCDLGGGTTDLSLIEVELARRGLAFRRSAVGRHLLLGGDNIDLALARQVEHALGGEPLGPERFGQLLLAAREAKDALLSEGAPDSFAVRLLGPGSELFGQSLSVDLAREKVAELVLSGFFPLTERGQLPDQRRGGLTTFGLPYERDPAITRHIWQFLSRHSPERIPQALLLNGGLSRSALVQRRLLECLRSWSSEPVVLLSTPDPELAVCRGAVRFGLALHGWGERVEGGAAQGYYVGVDAGGGGGATRALCVVPRGSREGERHAIATRRFALAVGRPARFELYASDTALHAPGALVDIDADFQSLPPLTTTLEAEGLGDRTRVEVQLEGELSAVGTVELGCSVVAAETTGSRSGPGRRISLEFELQPPQAEAPASEKVARPPAGIGPSRLRQAEEALVRVFGKGRKDVGPREVKDLVRTLERLLGPRKDWDVESSRKLCDVLLEMRKARPRSEDHERAFWMLAGHCLRPGFGHPRDPERIERLWQTFDAGLGHRDADRNWQQFWIAWRRVAGGLGEMQQARVRERIDPGLAPAELRLKKPKGLRYPPLDDLWSLASHLERVEPRSRAELGRWILERTWHDRDVRLWLHLGRVGARVPAYASAHHVVPGSVVERWVEQLLRERWEEVSTAARCALSLARVTGDQVRDLGPQLRQEVADALARVNAPEEWRRAVLTFVPVTVAERREQLGEDLPLGLQLIE